MQKKEEKGTWANMKQLPWWTWIFVVACGAIPIVTRGGAIPAVIGILGISLSVKITSVENFKLPVKLLLCFLVSAVCWATTWLVIVLISQL